MSASQILLAGHGPEDRWLTESPNRTYFEAKYPPRSNRFRETYEVPFDNQEATFGATGRCTIPVKGDYLTRLTLRAVFPPIYPTVTGEYVYPTPSSQVGGSVYANMGLTLVVADGVTLTANTVGNHYMSVGTAVTLSGTTYSIFDLDGTYTVTSIPTANSFTCSTTLAGISYNGTMSFVGIACGDIISYFSTTNSNLWVNNLTNKTWQITGGTNIGTNWTFTTSAPSNFPVGSQLVLNLPSSGYLNKTVTVTASTDTTFTCDISARFVAVDRISLKNAYSTDNGITWTSVPGNNENSVTSGNNIFVAVNQNIQTYSDNNGITWIVTSSLSGIWHSVAFGNGVFVMVSEDGKQAYSTDNGLSWNYVASPLSGTWTCVAYGNGIFVMVGLGKQAYSTNNGLSWTYVASPLMGLWSSVVYGNGVFVTVGSDGNQAYSTDDGLSWNYVATPLTGTWTCVAYGNGIFVAGGYTSLYYPGDTGLRARSTDNGLTWTLVDSVYLTEWSGVSFGNNTFVMVGGEVNVGTTENFSYSSDGISWNASETFLLGYWSKVAFGNFGYTNSLSDSVSFVVPPLQLTNRVFSSDVYPSISFANASDAAFWGFDARNGLTYSLTATPPWTLTQSGWVSGFLPPSTSTWDDSVAHKLVRDARILVGKQTIKEYSGEYIELQNDLTVPYENKAILKLLNGTLDQTQATVSREYYTTLPIGTKEIPLCALTHQQMSVEVDFESFTNLSQNLNPGTGDFLNPHSYLTYDASTGILGGQPINVQTTFSYQQYIFIVTYGGQFIVYDTTKNVADPTSYIVLSAFAGTSLFSQFCVLSGTLYIGLSDGTLASIIIDELIQGNISSFATNNYEPTVGSLTGTIVADFRYVYYTVSNTSSSNVFLSRYDTTGVFTSPSSYTTVDFTLAFNSNVTGVYQILSTGIELIVLPQGAPGSLYTYQLNANVQSQWYVIDYSSYGTLITECVLIGSTVYFVCDNFKIVKYQNNIFELFNIGSSFVITGYAKQAYSTDGTSWISVDNPLSGVWYGTAYGNGVFVMVGAVYGATQAYSTDNGVSWTSVANPLLSGYWQSVAFGNGVFVMVGLDAQAYSADNGLSWTSVANPLSGSWSGITYANGNFVMVGDGAQATSPDGLTWTLVISPLSGIWLSAAYRDGVFVMVGPYRVAYSTDNGLSWIQVTSPVTVSGDWEGVAYGNGTFVIVSSGYNTQAYSTDNGLTWNYSPGGISVNGRDVVFTNGNFYMVGYDNQSYSTDNGLTWILVSSPITGDFQAITASPPKIAIPGDGFKNLIAVGNYIYCSTSNVAVQIDTTQDLSTPAAYKFPAPVPDGQYVFANGPRYIYMFSQSDPAAQNIYRFDPYPPVPVLKTSILVDYESLPEGTKKPDKALIGLVQTQKVLDMTNMDIHGPVKELWVTGPSAASNVFQYANLAARSTLTFAGEHIVTEDDGTHTFLNIIEPFETHTSMPIRNVSVVSFEFNPESEIPNGTINFSRIRDQVFDGDAETVWARNYNLLAIQGGTGGLIFNS